MPYDKKKVMKYGNIAIKRTVLTEGVIPMKRSANFMDNFTGKP